jgi:hypothetical protein
VAPPTTKTKRRRAHWRRLELLFAAAVAAVVFARFCGEAWLYRLVHSWRRVGPVAARRVDKRA